MQLSSTAKEKLERYSSNIIKWNTAYNLLSSSQDAQQIWDRHIVDSLQISEHIPQDVKVITDLGSGAGFPGIPCAIISDEKKLDQKFVLIESVGKKTNFLEDTSRILGLKNISVRNERIENIKDVKAEVITARAFAKIVEIFSISKNLQLPDTIFVLHKGKNVEEEIKEAQQKFSFDYQLINSQTGDGFIFLAKNVKDS